MPESRSPIGTPAVPIQSVRDFKVSWDELLQSESPPRTLGSLKSNNNSNIRESILIYRTALAQYEMAKVNDQIPPLLKSALRLRAREAFDHAKRVQTVVRNEDARFLSLEKRMIEMAQGLAALKVENLNRDQLMDDFVLGERDQNKSLAVVKGIVRRKFVDDCRQKFYDGMIKFLEEYYIPEVIKNRDFERTYNPNKVPRSATIDPEAIYTDLSLPSFALPDDEQSILLFTDSSASGGVSVHSGPSIARSGSADVGHAIATSGGTTAARDTVALGDVPADHADHATAMSGNVTAAHDTATPGGVPATHASGNTAVAHNSAASGSAPAAHASETSGNVPPAEKREAHPAMIDPTYFRSLNRWNRLDWNKFWDKLLLTDPISLRIRYTHPVTKKVIERPYFWPSPALLSSWQKNIVHYRTKLQHAIKGVIEQRDDLLKVAEKKTPGNVWTKDIPLPAGSDPDVGSAEKTLSQKLSKIKALVRSVLPHRQLFVPKGQKDSRRHAKQVKAEGGSTLIRGDKLEELSKAVDDVQPNVTDQNVATIFPNVVIREEFEKFDASIEGLKGKLVLILFVEKAVTKLHILRDCIVACFPVKDEGNYYAHPSLPLDRVLSEHLRASLIEVDPNSINTSLYECEAYLNGRLSKDCTKLELSTGHDEDLKIPTTDGKVNEKGKGKQVH